MMIAKRPARATRALRIVDRLANREAPVLEFELALIAGQHDVGGFVQEGPHPPVPAFRYAADVVDLARLIPPRDQAQIGADISRSANAGGRAVNRAPRAGRLAFSAQVSAKSGQTSAASAAKESILAAFPRSRVARPLAEASQRNKGKPSPRTVCVSSPRSNRVLRDSHDVSGTNRQA
jgi:hypothetical protein